ncbi:MAG: 50S ribosomal protein L10 [Beggiatoa sp. IS2]|nr:MAG: 50S ribosomal protein L10 [Beggiatoa sp. IS2]
MPLKLEGKKRIVTEVKEVAMQAQAVVIAEYRGMAVSEMDELRVLARKAGVKIRVVRNTLARRAVEETPYKCIQASLVGPVALAFSPEEPRVIARLIRDFAKTHSKLVVKNVALGGRLLVGTDLDKVAKLPTYKEAIGTLMGTLQAPITQLVRTLAEPHTKLVRTLAAIRDSKTA